MQKKMWLTAIGIFSGLVLSGAVNSGGVSVDLKQIDAKQKNAGSSVNLLQDGGFESPQLKLTERYKTWYGGSYVWSRGTRDEAHREAISKLPQRTVEAQGGVNNSRCVKLNSPLSIQKVRNAKGEPMMFNSIEQMIAVPDSPTPVKYELTFMIKGQTFNVPGYNRMHYFVRFEDKVPGQYGLKQLREEINKSVNLTGNYTRHSLSFVAPPHTRRLTFRFCLYGLGEAYLDNVEVRPVAMTKEVKAFVMPFSWLDNTFCIGEKQVGALSFVLQNELQLPCQNLTLHLLVPAGFEVLAGNSNTADMVKKKLLTA